MVDLIFFFLRVEKPLTCSEKISIIIVVYGMEGIRFRKDGAKDRPFRGTMPSGIFGENCVILLPVVWLKTVLVPAKARTACFNSSPTTCP